MILYNVCERRMQNGPKTICFSVVLHRRGAQVSIFIAKVKTWLRKHAKTIVFFDFSNHARAQVPIFTPKMKNSRFARLARFARLSTRKWDFRRRSRPRELAQRSQDDVSLNKLPQIKTGQSPLAHDRFQPPLTPRSDNRLKKGTRVVEAG